MGRSEAEELSSLDSSRAQWYMVYETTTTSGLRTVDESAVYERCLMSLSPCSSSSNHGSIAPVHMPVETAGAAASPDQPPCRRAAGGRVSPLWLMARCPDR